MSKKGSKSPAKDPLLVAADAAISSGPPAPISLISNPSHSADPMNTGLNKLFSDLKLDEKEEKKSDKKKKKHKKRKTLLQKMNETGASGGDPVYLKDDDDDEDDDDDDDDDSEQSSADYEKKLKDFEHQFPLSPLKYKPNYSFLKHAKNNPNTIILPSIRRSLNALKSGVKVPKYPEESFMDPSKMLVVPADLNVIPKQVTEDEMQRFKISMMNRNKDEEKFYKRLHKLTNIPQDELYQLLDFKHLQQFSNYGIWDPKAATDNVYYEETLNKIRETIMNDPTLNSAYQQLLEEEEMMGARPDFLKSWENAKAEKMMKLVERIKHSTTHEQAEKYQREFDHLAEDEKHLLAKYTLTEEEEKKMTEEEKETARKKYLDVQKEYKRKFEMIDWRNEQFHRIAEFFARHDQMPTLKHILSKPVYDEMKIDPNDLQPIVLKEQLRAMDPSKIINKFLWTPSFKEVLRVNVLNVPAAEQFLREWQYKLQQDRLATESGMMTLAQYRSEIEKFWNALPDITGVTETELKKYTDKLKGAVGLPLAEREKVRKTLATLREKPRSLHAMMQHQLDENRKRIFAEMNIFNRQLSKMQENIKGQPHNAASKYADQIIKNILNEIKTGQIDVNEAYGKMNAAYRVTRPWRKDEKQFLESHKVAEVRLPTQRPAAPLDEQKAMESLRTKNNFFAFKGVTFQERTATQHQHEIMHGVYDPTQAVKRGMAADLRDILEDPQFHVDADKMNVPQLVAHLREIQRLVLDASHNLRELDFNTVDYPTLSGSVNWNDYDVHTEQDRLKLIKDYKNTAALLTDMRRWADANKNRPFKTKKQLAEAKATTIYLNFPKPEKYDAQGKKFKKAAHVIAPAEFAPEQPKEIVPTRTLEETERPEDTEAREKKYTFDNIKYAMKASKEYPETLKTEYKDGNVIEYNVQTEDDLKRMKSEVGRLLARGAKLFIIDLKTGRLYPINLEETFVKQVYIVMLNPEKEGGGFAANPARDSIRRHAEDLLPYSFMRHDKMIQFMHKLPKHEGLVDYTHQIRREIGGGLWDHLKKGISSLSSGIHDYAINKTARSAHKFVQQSRFEGNNFVRQEKRNLNGMYNAGSTFIKNPTWNNFSSGYWKASNNLGKLVMQPVLTGVRELSNVSDLASGIPGVNIAKYAAEFALPPLAVADALSHGVKNLGVGSDDKPKYFDAVLNLGDALIGSKALPGSAEAGARILQTGAQIADYLVDQKNHA